MHSNKQTESTYNLCRVSAYSLLLSQKLLRTWLGNQARTETDQIPFASIVFRQDSNHPLHRSQDSTVHNHWPFLVIAIVTRREHIFCLKTFSKQGIRGTSKQEGTQRPYLTYVRSNLMGSWKSNWIVAHWWYRPIASLM